MKNYYVLIAIALVIVISGCDKNESYNGTCANVCSIIQPSDTALQISALELEGGMYYGGLDQKKKGTPDNWIHTLEGTRSSSWRSPKSGKNYKCDCDEM